MFVRGGQPRPAIDARAPSTSGRLAAPVMRAAASPLEPFEPHEKHRRPSDLSKNEARQTEMHRTFHGPLASLLLFSVQIRS